LDGDSKNKKNLNSLASPNEERAGVRSKIIKQLAMDDVLVSVRVFAKADQKLQTLMSYLTPPWHSPR
jgi:hypothetical protein